MSLLINLLANMAGRILKYNYPISRVGLVFWNSMNFPCWQADLAVKHLVKQHHYVLDFFCILL